MNRFPKYLDRWTCLCAAVLFASVVSITVGQLKVATDVPTRSGPAVIALAAKSADAARGSMVDVLCDGAPMALGTVVGPSLILTKASELFRPIHIRGRDGKRREAKLLGIDDRFDLALLEADTSGTAPVVWSKNLDLPVGSWLVTPTSPTDPTQVAVGVLSVGPRDLRGRGFLGVAFNTDRRGVRVGRVLNNSGALQAGVKTGDEVIQIDGIIVDTINKAIDAIRKHRHGSTMKLQIKRGAEELAIDVVLTRRPDFRSTRQKMMERSAGRLSDRRTDFGQVFQHDAPIDPERCGGPIVGLDGKVVGINIARAGRTAAYAIPAAIIPPLIEPLQSGKFAPTDATELAMRQRRLDVRIWVVQKELDSARKRKETFWMKKFGDKLKALRAARAAIK
jgi:serine protease Do